MTRKCSHITLEERTLIQTRLQQELEARAIAGGYSSCRANQRARNLAAMPRVKRKLVAGNPLWDKVCDGLQQSLSPEQVAATLGRRSHQDV